jgi:hypothetical protein
VKQTDCTQITIKISASVFGSEQISLKVFTTILLCSAGEILESKNCKEDIRHEGFNLVLENSSKVADNRNKDAQTQNDNTCVVRCTILEQRHAQVGALTWQTHGIKVFTNGRAVIF